MTIHIGTPVYNPYAGEIGYISDIGEDSGAFLIGAGMKLAGRRLAVVYENGRADRDLMESQAVDWNREAVQYGYKPVDQARIDELLALAEKKRLEDEAALKAADDKAREEREAFNRHNVPSWAKAVIIGRYVIDNCDHMSDYFDTKTGETVILAFSKHTRDLFPEMRKAALNCPETAHLAGEKWLVTPVFVSDVRGNGHCYYAGQVSPWHHDETPEPFTCEAEAREWSDNHPLNDVSIDRETASFEWRISQVEFEHREKYSMGHGYYLKDGGRYDTGWEVYKLPISGIESVPVGRWCVPEDKPKATQKAVSVDTEAGFTLSPGTKPGYIEIHFSAKPGEAVRDELKAAGFRWSRFNKCWYGLKTNLPESYQ